MTTRRLITLLLSSLAALLFAAASSSAAPAPKVVGNRLVDATTGAAFVPHGVNWPSFEYACHYGYGYSNEAGPATVGPTDEQARLIAGWHANVVRVPLNQDCWLGDDGHPAGGLNAQGYRDAVADWVGRLHAAGLAVILDLHWSGPDGIPADGQRMMADERSPAFWSSVAARFRDDPSVLFDAFNEPFSHGFADGTTLSLGWSCWRDGGCPGARESDGAGTADRRTFLIVGMQPLVSAIRATGARQPILLGGLDYANDLRGWLAARPDDDQLVASFHNYDGQRCETEACWNAEIAPVAAQVPVVTGEFGETDCKEDHDRRYMDWADAHGVGYLAWQWVVLAPDEQANPACAGLALISDVQGTPNAPNGTALKSHLDALAAGGGAAGTTGGAGGGTSGSGDRRAPRPTKVQLRRTRRGLAVRVRLDEAATVRATLTRRGTSRPTTVSRKVGRGTHVVTLLKRRPARGRYHVSLRATDAAGNRSRAAGASLRVR
ncbi:cellulase family glycosylhydrolase [Patulibacter sp. NPDC049589]|uniref:glycoside hydrolase family 5 protein n=1 Tax=Patulibacter sp. NPDC049589 TaxID=3154731 RepID=UPI0034320921